MAMLLLCEKYANDENKDLTIYWILSGKSVMNCLCCSVQFSLFFFSSVAMEY